MSRSVVSSVGVVALLLVLLTVGATGVAIADHEPGHIPAGGDGAGAGAENETQAPPAGESENESTTANSGSDGSSFSDFVSENAGGADGEGRPQPQPDAGDGGVGEGRPQPQPDAGAGAGGGTAEGGSGGDGGGILDGVTDAVPSFSPKEYFLGTIEGAYEDLREGVVPLLNDLNFVFTGVTAPGSPTDILSWLNPPEPEWEMARNAYLTSVGLMLPFWALNMMQAFGMDNLQRQEEMVKENGATLLMYVGGWLLIAAMAHTVNVWTQALTPAAEEFLAAPEGLGQLGIGIVLGALVAKSNIGVLVVGLFLVMLVWFLILFIAGTWPIWWTMRSSGTPMLRTWGNYLITTFCIVLLVRATQALGLRFLFHLPFGEVGPGGFLVFVVITAMGLWFLLYKLLRVAIEKTAAASAMTLGMSYLPTNFSAGDAVRGAKRGARNTVSRARSTASTVRHAPQKVRNAPSAARQRVRRALPARFGGTQSQRQTPTYSGTPSMNMRARGSPTMAGGSNPSTQSRMVLSNGGRRSDSRSTSVAGSGKRRMRLQRNKDGSYDVVDK